MSRFVQLYRTTVGKKAIVAVTGIVLFGFVAGHMLGNLKVFTGTTGDGIPHVDEYAHFLRTMGEPFLPHSVGLWTARTILLLSLVLHVVAVIQLSAQNRAARPVNYSQPVYAEATGPARLMLVSGFLLLVFVVVHILHFTTGTIDITPIVHGQVYANLFYAFKKWFVALFYIVAMGLLGLHVYHGVWSLFQTLGWDNPDRNRSLRMFAAVMAVVLILGFSAVPVVFFMEGMPGPPSGETSNDRIQISDSSSF